MSDRFRLFEAAVGFTRNLAQRLPLVLVLDDLHWADPASLLLLHHFLESVVVDPVLVLITIRDTEPRRAELEAVLAEVRAQRITRLSLRGLDLAGSGALLAGDLDAEPSEELVAVLHRRTSGNPLFLLEVGRSLTESGALAYRDGQWIWSLDDVSVVIPGAVAQVIERRVDHLGRDARRVLEVGATAGFEFAADVVAHVAQVSQSALLDVLDAATRAGLVDELEHEPGQYRFGHPLVWDVLYNGLTRNRRALLHEQVAGALTAVRDPGDPEVVSQLAFHLLRAPRAPRARTLAHALDAVDLALRRRAFEEAVELCDAATALVPEADSDLRRALVSRKGLAFAAAWVETYHPGRHAVADATYEPPRHEK